MSTMLSGQASFKELAPLANEPSFVSAPPEQQVQFLDEYLGSHLGDSFKQAPPEQRQQFIQESVLPSLHPSAPSPGLPSLDPNAIYQAPQSLPQRSFFGLPLGPGIDDVEQSLRNSGRLPIQTMPQQGNFLAGPMGTMGYSPSSASDLNQFNDGLMTGLSNAVKGATFGYFDPYKPQQPLTGDAQALAGLNEFTGSILPAELAATGIESGARALGNRLLPRTTPLALAAGAGTQGTRQTFNLLSRLQHTGWTGEALRQGLGFGAYGALKSHPENQLDIGARLQSGITEGLAGAAFPALGEAGGRILRGGVKATRQLFQPSIQDIGLSGIQKKGKEAAKQVAYKVFEELAKTVRAIQNGEIDPTHVDPADYARLVTKMDQFGKAITTGRVPENPKQVLRIVRKIEGKAKIRAKQAASKVVVMPEAKPQKAHSPFTDIPEHIASNPKVVGYVSKEIAEQGGMPEGAITFSNNVAKHIRKHLGDFADLNAADEKEYLQAIIRMADEAYTQGHNKIVYKPSTAFSPANFPQKHQSLKKGGKLLWRRSESSGPAGSEPSSHAPTTESPGEQHIADGQSNSSQINTSTTTPQPSQGEYTPAEKSVKQKVRVYTDEVQAELDKVDAEYERKIKTLKEGKSISGSVYLERQMKGAGLERAAKKRRIIQGDSLEKVEGGLTDAELEQVKVKEAKNYTGKAVIVDGRPAKVQNVAFGKVKVEFEDGSTVSILPEQVKPAPKTKPKPTFTEKEIEPAVEKPAPVEAGAATSETGTPQQLTGSVQEMVEQGLKDSGLDIAGARKLLGEVSALGKADDDPAIQKLKEQRKALGNKRDEATTSAKAEIDAKIQERKAERKALRDKAGQINGNVREVLETDWDGKSPLANQKPVSDEQLKPDVVEHLITDPKEKAIFDKITEALKAGNSVRLEHQAEITGSTDAAAKVTNAGKVKVPVSTFTPTHFTVTAKEVNGARKEFVAVNGYNEAGHMSKYYINRTPEGSQILKVQKVLSSEAFIGVTPNVELGSRQFKVADVLGRAPREAGILTSEALENGKAFAKLFNSETMKQFSKPTQSMIRDLKKKGRFDEGSLNSLLKQVGKNKEELAVFCNIFGLK